MDVLTLQLAKQYTQSYTDEKVEDYVDSKVEDYVDAKVEDYVDTFVEDKVETYVNTTVASQIDTSVATAVAQLDISAEVNDEDVFDALTFSAETSSSTTLNAPFDNNVLKNCIITNELTKSGTSSMEDPATFVTTQPTAVTLNNTIYSLPIDAIYGFSNATANDSFDLVTGEYISNITKITSQDLYQKTVQYRNRSTTEGNKWLCVRYPNAVTSGDKLIDCTTATVTGLTGKNQTELQWGTTLSISFDYEAANTALAGTDYENVLTDEVVSALTSANFDGSWAGHTGVITGSITRGMIFKAIIYYMNMCNTEWYLQRATPLVTKYPSQVMPIQKGENTISIDGGHVKVVYDITSMDLSTTESVNLRDFGAIPNDSTVGSDNYKYLLQAVRTEKIVIIDDTYYINVDNTSNVCETVKIDGLNKGKLLVTTATNCINMFSIATGSTGIVDIQNLYIDVYSTQNYNVPTLVGVENVLNTQLNMQYVLFNHLYFEKPYTLFNISTGVDEDTTVNYLTVTNCKFQQAHYQHYKANTFHTIAGVGICYPVMRCYGMGYKHMLIRDNYFHNCFYVLEDNDTSEWENFQKEQLDFINNSLINDDFYLPESGYISMYTGMVMTRCNTVRFIDNIMQGLAVKFNGVANYENDTSTLFATYIVTAYSRDVWVEGNTYKNNCNFSTNNQLIKCKITRTGFENITSTKIYKNNSFIVENDWLTKTIAYATDYSTEDTDKLALITSLGWSFASDYSITNYDSANDVYDFCYAMSNLPVDYLGKSIVITNNYFRIEYFFSVTNECHAKTTIISDNRIEAECIIGTFGKINKLPNYSTLINPSDSTSHSVYTCDYNNIEIINNSIVEIPTKNMDLLTKCNRYYTETNSSLTQNDKFNEVFILVGGFSQQNDLSCNSVIIKNNFVYSHRFEFLFGYINELGHYYNVLKNVVIDGNTAIADNSLLTFTPAENYMVFSNNTVGKTRKGVFAFYEKGICDAPTTFTCTNNFVNDNRTGTEYSATDVNTAFSDLTTKLIINNYVNSNLVVIQ